MGNKGNFLAITAGAAHIFLCRRARSARLLTLARGARGQKQTGRPPHIQTDSPAGLEATHEIMKHVALSKYAEAGVSIDRGNAIVSDIKRVVRPTFGAEVLTDIGLFGGLFDISAHGCTHPVLVSSIDGVGTKLHIAAQCNRFFDVGRDIVAHCCNDIVVQGARPLFFLDYLASSRLKEKAIVQAVAGMAHECKQNGCALIGGETAEMPGTYCDGQVDIVGCIVGMVDRDNIIDGRSIVPGDVAIGLPSSGLHTNGYSLARKVLLNDAKLSLKKIPAGCDRALSTILLEPHRSYAPLILPLLAAGKIKGMAHITGGGLIENVPRILPANVDIVFDVAKIPPQAIFALIERLGGVSREEMFRVFNMGIGMVIIASPREMRKLRRVLARTNTAFVEFGKVVPGARRVQLKNL